MARTRRTVFSKPLKVVSRARAAVSGRIANARATIAQNAKKRSISQLESVLTGKETPDLYELQTGIARLIGDSETCNALLKNHTNATPQSKNMGHLLYRAAIKSAGLVAEESPKGKKNAARILKHQVESIARTHFSKFDAGKVATIPEGTMLYVPYFTRIPAISEEQIFESLQRELQSSGIKLQA